MLDQIWWRGGKEKKKEKEGRGRRKEGLHLLSSFLGDPIVVVRRSKMQSSSLRRELRVEIEIREFRQTSRGKRFFLLGFYSYLKSHLMTWFWFPGVVNGPGVQSQDFGIDGGNIRNQVHNLKLCRKLIFQVLGQLGRDPARKAGQPRATRKTCRPRAQHARHAQSHGVTRSTRTTRSPGAIRVICRDKGTSVVTETLFLEKKIYLFLYVACFEC